MTSPSAFDSSPQLGRVALITGASRGLGYALATRLAADGWNLVIDARSPDQLTAAAASIRQPQGTVTAVVGDVSDPNHRSRLAAATGDLGGLDLLVNNASLLGPSPQPQLADYPIDVIDRVYDVNTVAPLALFQLVLPLLEERQGRVVNVTSDAAIEAYPGWGGYGSSKSALDHLSAVLAVEHPTLSVYSFDPGDMATQMQQEAFPGEDISDRADPVAVVPALLELVTGTLPSGRYRAADLLGVG